VPEVAAEAPAEAAPAPVAPSSEAPKSDSGAPGSWQNQGGATVALTADQMAEIRSQIPQAEVVVTDRPQLHVRSGTRKGEIIDLDGDPREWLIGSDQQKADICFPDQNVSAEQAVLSVANQRWKISDLISKNKTFVNGQNTPISYLQSGDVIAFGTVQFAIALPESRPRKSSASRGKQKTAAPKKISTWLIVGIAAAVTVGLLVVALQFL
jgi:hypothetical protein